MVGIWQTLRERASDLLMSGRKIVRGRRAASTKFYIDLNEPSGCSTQKCKKNALYGKLREIHFYSKFGYQYIINFFMGIDFNIVLGIILSIIPYFVACCARLQNRHLFQLRKNPLFSNSSCDFFVLTVVCS